MSLVPKEFSFSMDGNTVSATGADRSSIVNGLVQKITDVFSADMQKDHTYYVIPRPSIDYHAASGYDHWGRGSFYWPQTGQSYHVIGERVYRCDTSYTFTEVTAGGNRFGTGTSTSDDDYESRTKIVEMKNGTAYVIFQPSTFASSTWGTSETWYMNSSHTITKITDAQFPSNPMPGLAELDGYLFVIASDGKIYNSDLNSPVNWTGDFLSCTRQSDRGTSIIRHLNYVVAFLDRSIEFFYDAGNASGSPLARVDGAFLQVGCMSPHSLVTIDNATSFVARNLDGNFYVGILDGMSVKKISSDYVDYVLSTLTLDQIKQVYAYKMNISGQDLYVMQCPGAGCTLVFNLGTKTWSFWANGVISTRFPMTSYCDWQLAANQYGVGMAATASSANSGKELFRVMNQCQDETSSGVTSDLVVQIIPDSFTGKTMVNKFLNFVTMEFDFPTTTDSHDFILSTSPDRGKNFTARETKTITGNDDLEGSVAWRKLGRFKDITLKFRFELNSTSQGTAHRFYKYYMDISPGSYGV